MLPEAGVKEVFWEFPVDALELEALALDPPPAPEDPTPPLEVAVPFSIAVS